LYEEIEWNPPCFTNALSHRTKKKATDYPDRKWREEKEEEQQSNLFLLFRLKIPAYKFTISVIEILNF